MTRKLVVCCDGTWNKPRDETNVYRTYKLLQGQLQSQREVPGSKEGWCYCEGKAADDSEVVLYYDKGVGTGFGELVRGGTFGQGLSDNVRDAYHFLAHHHRPGDAVYVFGFSRGAYTARSLCGFINRMGGLLENPSENDVKRAYLQAYALNSEVVGRPQGMSLGDAIAELKHRLGDLVGPDIDDLPRRAVTVRFVGVYDTVGALGVPIPSADQINRVIVGFHDTDFCPIVEHGVQALAVDEQRGPYAPTLWSLPQSGSLGPGQSCLQVWFPGVHSDIGGGYADKGIGNITLDFMLRRAAEHGLVIDSAQPLPCLDLEPLPNQHDSLDGLWDKVGHLFPGEFKRLRPIGDVARAQQQNDRPVAAGREMLHASLVERLGRQVNVIEETDGAPKIRSVPYLPANLGWSQEEILAGAGLPVFREGA
jgi:uncharacterized protein (DUF2235 family)